MSRLNAVKNAHLSVMPNVGHYKAHKKRPPYVVWAEDGAGAQRSDNMTGEQSFTGTSHLYTNTENDSLVEQTQTAFNAAGISWYLESIQHEDGTGYIHYAWVWEV